MPNLAHVQAVPLPGSRLTSAPRASSSQAARARARTVSCGGWACGASGGSAASCGSGTGRSSSPSAIRENRRASANPSGEDKSSSVTRTYHVEAAVLRSTRARPEATAASAISGVRSSEAQWLRTYTSIRRSAAPRSPNQPCGDSGQWSKRSRLHELVHQAGDEGVDGDHIVCHGDSLVNVVGRPLNGPRSATIEPGTGAVAERSHRKLSVGVGGQVGIGDSQGHTAAGVCSHRRGGSSRRTPRQSPQSAPRPGQPTIPAGLPLGWRRGRGL